MTTTGKFFKTPAPLPLGRIAEISGAVLAPGVDSAFTITNVAPLDKAGKADLTFLDNVKYRDLFTTTKAGACFVHPDRAAGAPGGVNLLLSKSPYKSYALAAQAFYPEPQPEARISAGAVLHPTARIGAGCTIAHGVVIGENAQIGPGCWLEEYAVIGDNVILGEKCRVGVHACISHAIIGDHVRLYTGARVGQDGFGFAIDAKGHVKVPQLGRVMIEDHVEIGANTTIDRGSGPDTVIGQGTWIDNLVQIGHNVKVGRGCIITAQVGIAGSTVIEDFVALGGQAGVSGHLRVGKGARIAAQSGVTRDVPPGEEQMGYPALPMRQFLRQIATLNRLIKKEKDS